MSYINVYKFLRDSGIFLELLTAIIGSFYFYKYKKTRLKYFLVLIWYVALNEITGSYIREKITDHNALLYNIYNVIYFTYFYFLYKDIISNNSHKKWIIFFITTYILALITNGFYENYLIQFQSIPFIIAAAFLIICVVFYFIDVLNSEKVLKVNKNLLFWISVGLLLYYVGIIPFRIVRNYYSGITDLSILFMIQIVLTIIMNICFIIGFIWSSKKQQY